MRCTSFVRSSVAFLISYKQRPFAYNIFVTVYLAQPLSETEERGKCSFPSQQVQTIPTRPASENLSPSPLLLCENLSPSPLFPPGNLSPSPPATLRSDPRSPPRSPAKPRADGADALAACGRRLVASVRGPHSRGFAREPPHPTLPDGSYLAGHGRRARGARGLGRPSRSCGSRTPPRPSPGFGRGAGASGR